VAQVKPKIWDRHQLSTDFDSSILAYVEVSLWSGLE